MTKLGGVYAALLTPRDSSGELDLVSYNGQLALLGRNPVSGYAINGATGEFTICADQELDRLLNETRQKAPEAQILCGIGAGDLKGSLHLAQLAAKAGATAALLPMPCFFPYRQDDLRSFVLAVADSAKLPILLYNLPQFTSGINVDTTLDLLTSHDNIVGIKDSSGSLDIVRAITQAKLPATRLIGNDGALAGALTENVCDGVVSGVACVLPEPMLAL
jgi:4-hydroxy-tetrahydrodipicolinate synthase